MDVIVYVETNFLMSMAMGREARGEDLLAAVSASVRVAIPSGCYMEAFSAFEDEQKRRTRFRAELDQQITCEPTTHRSVLKDSSPLPHRHDEWPWVPPAIASLGVGQSFSNL